MICPKCGVSVPDFESPDEQTDWLEKHGLDDFYQPLEEQEDENGPF